MSYGWKYLMNMLGLLKVHKDEIVYATSFYIDKLEIIILIVAFLCATPLFKGMLDVKTKWAKAFVNIWLIVLFVLSTATIASNTYNPFIYFRF
jgi:alginate O-acetyltransferase complex protein AlgI